MWHSSPIRRSSQNPEANSIATLSYFTSRLGRLVGMRAPAVPPIAAPVAAPVPRPRMAPRRRPPHQSPRFWRACALNYCDYFFAFRQRHQHGEPEKQPQDAENARLPGQELVISCLSRHSCDLRPNWNPASLAINFTPKDTRPSTNSFASKALFIHHSHRRRLVHKIGRNGERNPRSFPRVNVRFSPTAWLIAAKGESLRKLGEIKLR